MINNELCSVAMFAIFGVLVRMCVVELSSSVAHIPHQDFFANALGSFILGVLTSRKSQFIRYFDSKAAYSGAASGFCGSLTTLSGWIVQVVLQRRYVALLSSLCVALIAYEVGKSAVSKEDDGVQRGDGQDGGCCFVFAFVFVFVFVLLCAVFFRDSESLFDALLALCVAPFGAALRFALGLRNKQLPVPLFTLLVNVLGTVALAVLRGRWPESRAAAALGVGFCGSLTTVSSFVAELSDKLSQRRAAAIIYCVLTLALSVGGAALATRLVTL